MQIQRIASVKNGQDGAVWNRLLFQVDNTCNVTVYDLSGLDEQKGKPLKAVAEFPLGGQEICRPHGNAVCFGPEFYAPGDEFPLFYVNVYLGHSGEKDKRPGLLCAYRLRRDGASFRADLIQLLQVAFVGSTELWSSLPGFADVRPYGNFVIDREKNLLYAFTMRDAAHKTRYFAFDLPPCRAGKETSPGVMTYLLTEDAILEQFDCPYHRFLQGAACHDHLIFSLEGFSHDPGCAPAMRIIDPENQVQVQVTHFNAFGLFERPEMIFFYEEKLYWADGAGNLFRFDYR